MHLSYYVIMLPVKILAFEDVAFELNVYYILMNQYDLQRQLRNVLALSKCHGDLLYKINT